MRRLLYVSDSWLFAVSLVSVVVIVVAVGRVGRPSVSGAVRAPGMGVRLEVRVPCGAYWRQPRAEGNCTKRPVIDRGLFPRGRVGWKPECKPQHRTKVKPCSGQSSWVSERTIVTPDIQWCWDGIGAGGGGTSCVLTPGDLPWAGRASGSYYACLKPGEKSDHPIVALKLVKAGGAKEVMS